MSIAQSNQVSSQVSPSQTSLESFLCKSNGKKDSSKPGSKSVHYFMNFKQEWLDKKHPNYKRWVLEVKDDSKKFWCKACMKSYACDYLKVHETNESHLEKLKVFKMKFRMENCQT